MGEVQLGKLGEEKEKKTKPASDRRIELADVGSELREKQTCLVLCLLSLDFGDDERGVPCGRNINLTLFIISVSGSKSLVSFCHCFFHFG